MHKTLLAIVFLSVALADTAFAQGNIRQLNAREIWRVDGTEDGEPFGDIRDYVITSSGHLWMLDFKDQVIRRYDQNGKPLGTISRKGSGPGELRNANGMAVSPSGSIWVNDPSNSRISIFKADGTFERQLIRSIGGYSYRWGAWFDRETGDVVEQDFVARGARWRRTSAQGDTSSLPYTACPDGSTAPGSFKAESGNANMYSAYPFSWGGGMSPVGDGTAWCAGHRAMRVVRVHMTRLDTVGSTTVNVPAVPVTSAERDSAIAGIEKRIAQYRTHDFDKSKIPSTKPGITDVNVDDDGRLWVRHANPHGRKGATFDLHDRDGRHVGRLTLNIRIGHQPIRARGNTIWLTVLDDDDVPSLAMFRMQ